MKRHFFSWPALFLLIAFVTAPLAAQQNAGLVTRLVPSVAQLTIVRGDETPFTVQAVDASGALVHVELRITGPRGLLQIGDGVVTGLEPGEYTINVSVVVPAGSTATPPSLSVPVVVTWPAVDRVVILHAATLYAGTTVTHSARAFNVDGSARPDPDLTWATSDAAVATVDAFGGVSAHAEGTVTIRASFEGVTSQIVHGVVAFPGAALELRGAPDGSVRTGDVVRFEAVVRDASGAILEDAPVNWSHGYTATAGMLGVPATGQMKQGAFVADVPGIHTVTATAGPLSARASFEAKPRDVVQELEIVGHGLEDWYRTTDIWIFEGVDGRDYAITGSKVSGGFAFFYDVTDPSAITKIDSLQVDARTINDVKASPDGRYAVLSREGATNRRDGLVILDMADPRNPRVAALYDEGITGGVHNMFAENDYLYALSNGDKYVIIDVRDIYQPEFVSEYNHPNSRVHDIWVHDGLVYSAEWETGVVVVDVGNGKYGGSIENPAFVTSFPLTTGSTHAVFPYYQESTGRFLLIAGDERVQRQGLAWEGTGSDHRQQFDPVTGKGGYPRATSGYIQIVDFTDPMNPEQLARYEVSEYGTHNIWVEDDVLYQAYYEGGVRMVDISGDLMGNLYTQGREIAVFKAHDPIGYIPNSPGAWSVMPWKGNVFFSDINSGMWAVKVQPVERPIS